MLHRIIGAILISTVLSLSLISCHTTPDSVITTLSLAEECMEAHPDSALNLLKNIPDPEALRGKSQADYCLLMTQAMTKNRMIFESDSLIFHALEYYDNHDDDWVKKGKTYFYYGRVLRDLNRQEDAMRHLLKAKEIFDGTKEYKMQGLIVDYIGALNWTQKMYAEALSNYKKSRVFYEKAGDMLCVSSTLRDIGRTFFMSNELDSGNLYYREALVIAKKHKCSSESSIIQELGMLYRAKRDYKTAESYLLKALQMEEGKEQSFAAIQLSLGYLYYQMQDFSKAEKYLNLSLSSSYIHAKADSYNVLYRIEKKKNNPWLAIAYKEKSDSVRKEILNEEVRKNIADLQRKYENEKLEKENLQLKMKYQTILLICSIPSVAILFLAIFYHRRLRENRRQIAELEQQYATNLEDIAMYQRQLTDYDSKSRDYQQLQYESEKIDCKIGELNGKLLVLEKQNRDLTMRLKKAKGKETEANLSNNSDEDNALIATFRNLLAIKKEPLNGDLSDLEWKRVFDLLNFLYNDYIIRLYAAYPSLTKHDIEICCLVKIGFTNEELKCIFMNAPDSVTKAKSRLKKRLNLSVQEDLACIFHTLPKTLYHFQKAYLT